MSEACVILAAGRGQRMGQRNKALLALGEKTFLATIVERCRERAVREIVVVIAQPHASETRAAAHELQLHTVVNKEPELGMGSSVAAGFAYAREHFAADYAWLWPVDIPAIKVRTLHSLSQQRSADSVVIPTYQNRGGHPVLVARSVWLPLSLCGSLPQGARSVFRDPLIATIHVPVEDPATCKDIDTPSDLLALTGVQA